MNVVKVSMSHQPRKEPRILSRGPIHLVTGESQWIPGTIHDVSVNGMSVLSEIEIAAGMAVRVEGTGFSGEARVRHCTADGGGFRIGLELLSPE
jgi:hypothetical protein